MINSVYTHKEIFLRELISNASDALDKLYLKSLRENLGLTKGDFKITIETNAAARTVTISDNGIGMSAKALEENLGTIAKSGSLDFKKELAAEENKDDISIIGQFGVGFYSAFMLAEKVEVLSKEYGSEEANVWTSDGVNGFEIAKAAKDSFGSQITLFLKPDSEDNDYSEYLESYTIREIVKKYSDFVRYPIVLKTLEKPETEDGKVDENAKAEVKEETLNSMSPLWKKRKQDISEDDYNAFYKDTFFDYDAPVATIHTVAEGALNYKALLFIPSHAPYDYYSKTYKKGLKLYTGDILIAAEAEDLLPSYFGFVKGIVETETDLNVSRETVQQNRVLNKISENLAKKIKSELVNLQETDKDKYEKFFAAFGRGIKYGLYESYGQAREMLEELLIYKSVKDDKYVSFKDYIASAQENQKEIYYVSGKTVDGVKTLPQTEMLLNKGLDILLLTDDVDEFALKLLGKYADKEFKNVASADLDASSEEVGKKDLCAFIKDSLGGAVTEVKFTNALGAHPVALTSKGDLSVEMEKVLSAMPDSEAAGKAQKVLLINNTHSVATKLQSLYGNDNDALKEASQTLLTLANLIEGIPPKSPSEFAKTIAKLL
jgi:molecular chaperone HtpG